MKRLSQQEVIARTRARAILETQLCTEMYGLYNSPAILNPIRNIVSLAIEQILGMLQFKSLQGTDWNAAIKKAGGNLAVWRHSGTAPKETSAALFNVWNNAGQWTADDCGDLIRLFGGLIEDTSLHGGAVGSDVDGVRKGMRKSGFGATRARFTDGFSVTDQHIGAGHLAILDVKRVQGGFSGIGKVRLKDESTVKKIDCAYGLAEGCDISGTTADSIFFFDYVSKFIAGLPEAIPPQDLPLIQLFPMATMGSQGHHTVLECALTLTQNKLIEYRVGFYSTLMPPATNNTALQQLFLRYENDPRNTHMLTWWDERNTKLNGVHFNKPWEAQMLKQASLADPSLLQDFDRVSHKAQRAQILGLSRYQRLAKTLGL